MLKKLYVNNYKVLSNFELKLNNMHSSLLIGRNGSGKSTIIEVMEIFQQIGRGVTSLKKLFPESSFSFGNKSLPIELELEVEIGDSNFVYKLEVEFPSTFIEPRIRKEILSYNTTAILNRTEEQMSVNKKQSFVLDWHQIGLPLVFVKTEKDPLGIFKEWLSRIVLLSPFPKLFCSVSKEESPFILRTAENIIDWSRWLLASNPSLYPRMFDFIKKRMHDIELFKFENIGQNDRRLTLHFKQNGQSISLDFSQLSDGEKIIFLASAVLAEQENGSFLCIWDEPDNFISMHEISSFIITHRSFFESPNSKSQLVVTSHNSRVINSFSDNHIFVLSRSSHLSPTRLRCVDEIAYNSKTIIDAYDNGELDDHGRESI